MRIELKDKVALVTGSARRIGRAIALELAKQGLNILVHYHSSDPSQVRDTLQEIKSLGVDAFAVRADLSQAEGVEDLFSAYQQCFDRLDIVVNNAAVFQQRAFLDVSLEDWDLTMALNLRAPFLITQRAALIMQDNPVPGGTIINICDAGVDGPWSQYPHHGISKSGLWMLTQVSALSLAPTIRVNAVVPGPVLKTDRRDLTDAAWAEVAEHIPLKRTGSAGDVARAVLYLCQEDYISGALLHLTGGEHLT
ncbi:MAG: SDR family oxidoreductase [Chloroflexota bacterium]|nr:SDR family oxidoreductase [Chloroflexota bacterium]